MTSIHTRVRAFLSCRRLPAVCKHPYISFRLLLLPVEGTDRLNRTYQNSPKQERPSWQRQLQSCPPHTVSTSRINHPSNRTIRRNTSITSHSYSPYPIPSSSTLSNKMRIKRFLIALLAIVKVVKAAPSDDMASLQASCENAANVLNTSLNNTMGMVRYHAQETTCLRPLISRAEHIQSHSEHHLAGRGFQGQLGQHKCTRQLTIS